MGESKSDRVPFLYPTLNYCSYILIDMKKVNANAIV